MTESLHYEVRHFGIRSVLIEPGLTATDIHSEPHQGPADYAELWEQAAGAGAKMAGPSGPQGPEVVASAIAHAIEDPATPLRVPVGQDAEVILGLRRSLDDQAFEAAMRKAIHWVYVVIGVEQRDSRFSKRVFQPLTIALPHCGKPARSYQREGRAESTSVSIHKEARP